MGGGETVSNTLPKGGRYQRERSFWKEACTAGEEVARTGATRNEGEIGAAGGKGTVGIEEEQEESLGQSAGREYEGRRTGLGNWRRAGLKDQGSQGGRGGQQLGETSAERERKLARARSRARGPKGGEAQS